MLRTRWTRGGSTAGSQPHRACQGPLAGGDSYRGMPRAAPKELRGMQGASACPLTAHPHALAPHHLDLLTVWCLSGLRTPFLRSGHP